MTDDALDLDRDGLRPLAEYATGGSPVLSDAARNPSITTATLPGPPPADFLLFTYHWRRGADDLTATVQQSTDFNGWSDAPTEPFSTVAQPDGTDLITLKTLPTSPESPVFLRLRWRAVATPSSAPPDPSSP